MKRLFCFCFSSCVLLAADQIVMKNGDRLTGTILKYDGKEIVIQSEFAGKVSVKWDAVTEVKSDNPLYVVLKDGQTIVGTVATNDGKIAVHTKETGTVTAESESVTSIRNKAVHEAEVERYRNPGILDLWAGFVDMGFAQSTGNSIVSTVNSSANATRATLRDKVTVNFTSIYSRNNTNGVGLLVANAMRGGVGYNLNVSPRMFVFGSSDLEFDEFQKLDLRFVPAGGFGYHVRKSDRAIFDIFGGAALNKEFYSTGVRRTSGELQFGDEITRKFFKGVSVLHQKLVIYPNLTQMGEERINFDLSQATTLRKWLSWQVSFSNRYISNPLPGRKTNDLLITTGLRITFAR